MIKLLKDIIEINGDKLVYYKNAEVSKKYISVFNYSIKNGGIIDSFKYYNNYVVELKNEVEND